MAGRALHRGHPGPDFTNTVFDRAHPAPDNELLRTPEDVLTWCESVGFVESAPALNNAAADGLTDQLRSVREHAWAVFDAVSRGQPVPTVSVGALLERSGAGRLRGSSSQHRCRPGSPRRRSCPAPGAIPTALSLLAVHALFTLPAERVRGCGRCGWLFLDTSRGGRRRWCSMSTCGNRAERPAAIVEQVLQQTT